MLTTEELDQRREQLWLKHRENPTAESMARWQLSVLAWMRSSAADAGRRQSDQLRLAA